MLVIRSGLFLSDAFLNIFKKQSVTIAKLHILSLPHAKYLALNSFFP